MPGCLGWGRFLADWVLLRWIWSLSCFPPSLYLTGTSCCLVLSFHQRSAGGSSLHFRCFPLQAVGFCFLCCTKLWYLFSIQIDISSAIILSSLVFVLKTGFQEGAKKGVYSALRVSSVWRRRAIMSRFLFCNYLPPFSLSHTSSGHEWLHRYIATIPLILHAWSGHSGEFSLVDAETNRNGKVMVFILASLSSPCNYRSSSTYSGVMSWRAHRKLKRSEFKSAFNTPNLPNTTA